MTIREAYGFEKFRGMERHVLINEINFMLQHNPKKKAIYALLRAGARPLPHLKFFNRRRLNEFLQDSNTSILRKTLQALNV